MVSKKKAKELLKRELEELSVKQTVDNLDEILTNNWVVHQPGGDLGIKEVKEGYRKRFAEGRINDVVEDMIISGDMVVVRWTNRFTPHTTGIEVCSASISIDKIRDGKFAETWYLGSDKPWLK
jgi:ketosteroid isomerase-like protein